MSTNINQELFRRYAPKTKIKIIESLTQDELLAITPATITRIIKETGEPYSRSKRDKSIFVRRVIRAGNNWNSEFTGMDLLKGKLYVSLYVQYSNTDTTECIPYIEFMRDADRFRGTIKTTDRYDNPQTYYYFYDNSDRARAVKSLLLEYVYTKYLDKLKD
jgi:hypothetical protein